MTSKEALQNMDLDDKNKVKILSNKEENQFRDMILSLLVSLGTRKRHVICQGSDTRCNIAGFRGQLLNNSLFVQQWIIVTIDNYIVTINNTC